MKWNLKICPKELILINSSLLKSLLVYLWKEEWKDFVEKGFAVLGNASLRKTSIYPVLEKNSLNLITSLLISHRFIH